MNIFESFLLEKMSIVKRRLPGSINPFSTKSRIWKLQFSRNDTSFITRNEHLKRKLVNRWCDKFAPNKYNKINVPNYSTWCTSSCTNPHKININSFGPDSSLIFEDVFITSGHYQISSTAIIHAHKTRFDLLMNYLICKFITKAIYNTHCFSLMSWQISVIFTIIAFEVLASTAGSGYSPLQHLCWQPSCLKVLSLLDFARYFHRW